MFNHVQGVLPSEYASGFTETLKRSMLTANGNPAMTKSQTETYAVEHQKRVAYRTIEAPVTYELLQPDNDTLEREPSRVNRNASNHAIAIPGLPHPCTDDLIARSEHSHHASTSIAQKYIESVTNAPNVTKISVADSGKSRASHASSPGKTARQSDFIPVTEVRSAKDVPLPPSRVTSLATEKREGSKAGKSSVCPKESVSQVSTRRSGGSGRSKHYGNHNSRKREGS